MTRTWAARVLALPVSAVALALTWGGAAAAQSQGQAQEMFICHRTGSPTNPWVFMSIDASTWPEHQAQGDVRATSLADCPAPAPAAAPAAQEPAPIAPAAQPPQAGVGAPGSTQPASAAQGSSQGAGSGQGSSSQAVSPVQSPAPVANVQAAGPEQARSQPAEVEAEAAAPPVSSLPASGEPDRPALVLGLLALLGAGLGLRRLGRRHA